MRILVRYPRRVIWTAVGSAVALACAWVLICTGVLLHPRVTENPQPADAVFVLGPADSTRVEEAARLMDSGIAPTVVVATPDPVEGTWPSDAEFMRERPFCDDDLPYEIICFAPDPSTTQGEAIKLRELAEERGWENVIVLTYRPHVARAQLIVGRCFDGTTQWPTFDYHDDYSILSRSTWREYGYQTAGFLKAWVTPGCDTQLPWRPKSGV
ncbi:YdcF family protein [Kocuria coralli]|uniref:YdcF family protein n=1 Tax=Kocuria coralli TaxID=1461025 RepID=A0A5J5KX20_9MICC|nr:YdcF family protein [Kocuria coralli]KAA9394184.1 YdcF family protein [Kocuria coralli]